MDVFFYGLFMDKALLARQGVSAHHARVASVDGFALRIGARATLVPSRGARAYGVLMTISANEVRRLYAEDSVSDYVPEPVTAELMDSSQVAATCYNLPVGKLTGSNAAYAEALWQVAHALGLPEHYLNEIRRAVI